MILKNVNVVVEVWKNIQENWECVSRFWFAIKFKFKILDPLDPIFFYVFYICYKIGFRFAIKYLKCHFSLKFI